MEIRVLEYFLAVANEENITRAANMLHVSQPTLSRVMMELEEELDTKLFIKTNRYTKLTPEGIRLKKRAEEIVELTRRTEQEFKNNDEIIQGEIHIGAGETTYFSYVADAIKNTMKLYPDIHFHIHSYISTESIQLLDEGLLDFAFVIDPVDLTHYNYVALNLYEKQGVVVSNNSKWSDLEYADEKILLQMPLIIARERSNYIEAKDEVATIMPHLNIVANCDLPFNGIKLVEANIGCFWSVWKEEYVYNPNVKFVPLTMPIHRKWYLAWKKTEVYSKANEVFLEEFKKVIPNNEE